VVTTSSRIGTPPKPAPSAVLDRLEAAARAKLDEYENIITEECARIEKKIAELVTNPSEHSEDQPEKIAQTATAMVKNALESAQAAANKRSKIG